MNHLIRALLLLAFPTLMVGACKAQAHKTDDKSLLWKISGNNSSKPSFLFGTIHMICPDDYIWTDAMKESLAATTRVSFEMDMDDPTVMADAASGMMKASGKKLKEYFTEAEYSRLRTFVRDSIGIDISMLQSLSPVVLQVLFLAKTVDCAFPVSYEANIMEEAKKSGKGIVGLEEVDEQLALLNGLPDDSSAAMLMQLVDSFGNSKAEFASMLRSYKEQDLPALYQIVKESKELGDDLGAFLDDRNRKWIPRIKEQMKSGPVFFAVGAAHLYGADGVISLLKKAGYSVTPVR